MGKTTTALALMSGLQRRFPDRVGFMKPVGQQSLTVVESSSSGQRPTVVQVDKDAALVKQYFGLDRIPYQQTSPVLIPPGT